MDKRLQWASCFLFGACALTFFSSLPALPWWLILLFGGFLCKWPGCRLPAMVLLGFAWAGHQAAEQLSTRLPPAYEGVDVMLQGQVASLPLHTSTKSRFIFDVEKVLDVDDQRGSLPIQRIRLNWYQPGVRVRAGERWQFTVRLKQPHGFSNPAGFDYEAWLFQKGIDGLGYVRTRSENQRLSLPSDLHANTWRSKLRRQFTELIPQAEHQALITALAIGDRSGVSEAQWRVLRQTGTSHLMAISGLHIGLVSGFVFALARVMMGFAGFRRFSPQRCAVLMAIVAAGGYAALSGFAIPAQRALVMVLLLLGAVYSQRHLRSSTLLATALFGVLLLDPLAVMSAGFWLSFGAVAALMWGMSGFLVRLPFIKSLGYAQWVVALGLGPLAVLFFHQWPVISPLCNFFAVPWVSFVVVPLVMVGTVLMCLHDGLGQLILMGADLAITLLWWGLETLSRWPYGQWRPALVSPFAVGMALMGSVLLLAPRGVPARCLSVLLFLPVCLPVQEQLKMGEFRFTLLDVGQGLSSVVETRDHVLVFDTGARWGDRFDLAKSVVSPYLNGRGHQQIDRLIISHGDNDHAGGVDSLLSDFDVKQVLTSVPNNLQRDRVLPCFAGQRWQWDEVRFEMLHPPPDTWLSGNNASCVLRIESRWGSALLTGDIERSAERMLISAYAEHLNVDLLVAPHHGSSTSSTSPFIETVSAQQVLFPVGYRNRFGFPRPAVLARYEQQGSHIYDTAQHGALIRSFGASAEGAVRSHRIGSRRYWHWRSPLSPASP